jgi:hypothetical protein
MKKILFVTLFVTTLLRADLIGTFGLGYSKGDNDGNYVTGFGQMGLMAGLGIRLEYTKNFDEHKSFSKEDVSRYGLFAVYPISIFPSIELTPKAGFTKTDGEWKLVEGLKKFTDSKSRFSYGLEVDYYLNNQFSAFIGYTDYGKKLDIKEIKSSDLDRSNYMIGFKLHL